MIGAIALLLAAQTAAPVFDVASVKPVTPGAREPIDIRVQGGRLTVTNLTLKNLVQQAFKVRNYQLAGGPAWLDTDRFDISATTAHEVTHDEAMQMLQILLTDRFGLKIRREVREGNVFNLIVAKNGPKLRESTAEKFFIGLYRNTPPDRPGVNYTIGAKKATMALFAERLGELEAGRPVIDRTGLTGEFDFKLEYGISDGPEAGASIFTAIQEQLGLKLEPAKGLVEMLIVERAEKPSAN